MLETILWNFDCDDDSVLFGGDPGNPQQPLMLKYRHVRRHL